MRPTLHPEMTYFVLKECTPAWRLDNEAIAFYEILLILAGEADYRIDGEAYRVRAGNALFLRPGCSRHARTPGMSCAALDFVLPGDERLELPALMTLSAPAREELRPWLGEIDYAWLGEGGALRCQGYFLLVLDRLLSHAAEPGPYSPHVERIKRYIVEHYGEKLTVRDLAAACGIHPAYAGALFKRCEGCSISGYIQRVRVNKAAALLETGEYRIGEAAQLAGFTDVYYFSSVFKKLTGVPPTAYRRRPGGSEEIFHPPL